MSLYLESGEKATDLRIIMIYHDHLKTLVEQPAPQDAKVLTPRKTEVVWRWRWRARPTASPGISQIRVGRGEDLRFLWEFNQKVARLKGFHWDSVKWV